MPNLFRRSEPTEPSDPSARNGPGPDMLRSGLLLSPWFIDYRLQEEIDRARRYGRPLAIMLASPELLEGERLSRAAREAGAEAALQSARASDLVGWWSGGSDQILIIMPETMADVAKVGASRLRDDMWLRGRAVRGPKWDIALLHDPDEFKSRDLVDELMRQRVEAERRRRTGMVHVEDAA
jgi:hypothetical protein